MQTVSPISLRPAWPGASTPPIAAISRAIIRGIGVIVTHRAPRIGPGLPGSGGGVSVWDVALLSINGGDHLSGPHPATGRGDAPQHPTEHTSTAPIPTVTEPHHRQGTATDRAHRARRRTGPGGGRRAGRRVRGQPGASADPGPTSAPTAPTSEPTTVPTPEQWAQEQLKKAPRRSQAWARAVATLYGLDMTDEHQPGEVKNGKE